MIIAVTGIILILFVIGHLLGNLQIFLGPDWINGYSQHLRDLGPLLWFVRIFLLATVVTHIYVTIQLAIEKSWMIRGSNAARAKTSRACKSRTQDNFGNRKPSLSRRRNGQVDRL